MSWILRNIPLPLHTDPAIKPAGRKRKQNINPKTLRQETDSNDNGTLKEHAPPSGTLRRKRIHKHKKQEKRFPFYNKLKDLGFQLLFSLYMNTANIHQREQADWRFTPDRRGLFFRLLLVRSLGGNLYRGTSIGRLHAFFI